jgi:hypothetical protein
MALKVLELNSSLRSHAVGYLMVGLGDIKKSHDYCQGNYHEFDNIAINATKTMTTFFNFN